MAAGRHVVVSYAVHATSETRAGGFDTPRQRPTHVTAGKHIIYVPDKVLRGRENSRSKCACVSDSDEWNGYHWI